MIHLSLSLTLLAGSIWTAQLSLAQPAGGGGDVTITEPTPRQPAKREGGQREGDTPVRPGAAEIDLRPKFITGRTTRYEFTLDHQIATEPAGKGGSAPGQPSGADDEATESSLKQRMRIAVHTVDATETSSLVELTIESFGLSLETGDFQLQASSDATTGGGTTKPVSEEDRAVTELLDRVVKSIAGTKLQMTLDERGNITNVKGGESLSMTGLVSQLAGGAGGGLGGAGLLPGGNGGSGGGGLQWLISGASGQPARARAGQTWTNNDKLGSTPIGDLQLITRHTVRSIRGDLAEIAFDGHLEPVSTGSNSAPANSGRVKQSAYKGSYTWDGRAGELGRMSGEMRSELESGGSAGTQTRSLTRMSAERTTESPKR